jgi:hypothetical protein
MIDCPRAEHVPERGKTRLSRHGASAGRVRAYAAAKGREPPLAHGLAAARQAGIAFLQAGGDGVVSIGIARRMKRFEMDPAALQARVAELTGMP